jgi:hypothetical protein
MLGSKAPKREDAGNGLQEGHREELIGQIHFCQRFLKRPMTSQEELARLSVEELRGRVESLQAEMLRS